MSCLQGCASGCRPPSWLSARRVAERFRDGFPSAAKAEFIAMRLCTLRKNCCSELRPGGVCALAKPNRNWTGAPRSPQRTPDFLSSLLALAHFMRLSLLKAAHADVGGAPCRKSGYVGRK